MTGEELIRLIGTLLEDYRLGLATDDWYVVNDPGDTYVYVFQRGEDNYHFAIDVHQALVEVSR